MTDAIRERVARAIGYARWRVDFDLLSPANQERIRTEADAAVRAILLEEVSAPLWTVANHDTYATLHRPDGTIAARFHVVAECEAVARVLNWAREISNAE